MYEIYGDVHSNKSNYVYIFSFLEADEGEDLLRLR